MNNPFVVGEKIELIRIGRTKFISNTKSDGVQTLNHSYTTIRDNVFIDKDSRVSLYKPTDLRNLFCSFNGVTLKLYVYIALSLQKDCDYVKVDSKDFMLRSNVKSKSSFYKAIEELETYSIILKKEKNYYWVNPFLLFNGNRVAYFQTNYPEQISIVATIKK